MSKLITGKDLDLFIRDVAAMTARNSHTEARLAIALRYDFTSLQAEQLAVVKRLHARLGYLPAALGAYRDALHAETMALIGREMGSTIARRIGSAL